MVSFLNFQVPKHSDVPCKQLTVWGWWFTILGIRSREYHLEVQLKKLTAPEPTVKPAVKIWQTRHRRILASCNSSLRWLFQSSFSNVEIYGSNFQRVIKHSIERMKSSKRVPRTSMSYCRWKKSCTSWCGSFSHYLQGGAGFFPSTVLLMVQIFV